jgi:hypothetical protein
VPRLRDHCATTARPLREYYGDIMRTLNRLHILLACAICAWPAFEAHAAGETEWLVAPYLWYPSISLDQSAGDGGGISASDLLSKTDAAGMARVEVARDHWGLTVDYLFLSVADSRDTPLPFPPDTSASVQADLDLTVFEIAGIFRPSGNEEGISYLAGLRSISSEKVLLVTPPTQPTRRFDADESVTDVLFGVRYLHRFNNRWDVNLRGDYSLGDSEGTWNLIGGVGYRFNDVFAIDLGYRHALLEYEETADGETNTTTIELSGPLLGLLFRF